MERLAVLVAGATGDLGGRIVKALINQGTKVRALVRPEMSPRQSSQLHAMGVETRIVDFEKVESLSAACEGIGCVISALNGLREVIVDRQKRLLDAAVLAKVPRFIPSDYAADFTKIAPGVNRNFDLRREFMEYAESQPIQKASILNGAFMDMLGAEMPILQPSIRRVLYWGHVDQPLDFTTKDDAAQFAAAAAVDETAPRFLKVAGATVSAREFAEIMTKVTGQAYKPLRAGSVETLGLMIKCARFVAPQPRAVFPAWQGMQYMRDMFSGRAKLDLMENARYPQIRCTSLHEHLSRKFGKNA